MPSYFWAGALHGIADFDFKKKDNETEMALIDRYIAHNAHIAAVYNRGIRARQRVHAAALSALNNLTAVMERNEQDLPILFREEGRTFLRAMNKFVNISSSKHVDNLLTSEKRKRNKEGGELFTNESAALIMWKEHLPAIDQKCWQDMHVLAQVWGLTRSVELSDFKRRVYANHLDWRTVMAPRL
jgi:hypothetical protein